VFLPVARVCVSLTVSGQASERRGVGARGAPQTNSPKAERPEATTQTRASKGERRTDERARAPVRIRRIYAAAERKQPLERLHLSQLGAARSTQRGAKRCKPVQLQRGATWCNTLERGATWCNTTCSTVQRSKHTESNVGFKHVAQHVAALQFVAT
jgi:hypothetical protein